MATIPKVTPVTDADVRAGMAEFIATLLFVFIGAGTVVVTGIMAGGVMSSDRLVAIALANGLAIAVLVAATARISGGHINPAVTVAALVAGKISLTRGVIYVALQVAGAIVGAFLLMAVIPDDAGSLGAHGLGAGIVEWQALLIEGILTFALVFVIFATAMDPKGPATIAPLAIGLVIVIAHILAVPLTGPGLNPARSIGPAVAGGDWAAHWVYWVGPMVGAVVAALTYQKVFLREED